MTTDQSPIHRGLANYDVLCTVFDTIRLRKADLRNAALVCRTFKEPALRKLWRTLANSIPLWHLLAPENIAYPNRITEAYLDLVSPKTCSFAIFEPLERPFADEPVWHRSFQLNFTRTRSAGTPSGGTLSASGTYNSDSARTFAANTSCSYIQYWRTSVKRRCSPPFAEFGTLIPRPVSLLYSIACSPPNYGRLLSFTYIPLTGSYHPSWLS